MCHFAPDLFFFFFVALFSDDCVLSSQVRLFVALFSDDCVSFRPCSVMHVSFCPRFVLFFLLPCSVMIVSFRPRFVCLLPCSVNACVVSPQVHLFVALFSDACVVLSRDCLFVCLFVALFSDDCVFSFQVFHSLLKAHAVEARSVVRQALEILTPAMPARMEDGNVCLPLCCIVPCRTVLCRVVFRRVALCRTASLRSAPRRVVSRGIASCRVISVVSRRDGSGSVPLHCVVSRWVESGRVASHCVLPCRGVSCWLRLVVMASQASSVFAQAMLTHWTKKIIVEEGHTVAQLVHML